MNRERIINLAAIPSHTKNTRLTAYSGDFRVVGFFRINKKCTERMRSPRRKGKSLGLQKLLLKREEKKNDESGGDAVARVKKTATNGSLGQIPGFGSGLVSQSLY